MRRSSAIAIATSLLAPGTVAWSASVVQTGDIAQLTEGACSPPVVGNTGRITISCSGVDERALHYLENKLSEQFRNMQEQLRSLDESSRTIRNLNDLNETLRQKADDWARRYHELSARLNSQLDDSTQTKQARTLIQSGKFDEAEAILQRLASEQEASIGRAAAYEYSLGDLQLLKFEPNKALPHYAKAYRLEPTKLPYALSYADVAFAERDYTNAEKALNDALDDAKEATTPGTEDASIAAALLGLGEIYINTSRPREAEKVFSKALKLTEGLVAKTPSSGQYKLILSNANLDYGLLYMIEGKIAEAETSMNAAISIGKTLIFDAAGHTELINRGKITVIGALNDLSTIYLASNQIELAEKSAEKALEYCKTVKPDVTSRGLTASTDINLGMTHISAGKFTQAEKDFKAALLIKDELASHSLAEVEHRVAGSSWFHM